MSEQSQYANPEGITLQMAPAPAPMTPVYVNTDDTDGSDRVAIVLRQVDDCSVLVRHAASGMQRAYHVAHLEVLVPSSLLHKAEKDTRVAQQQCQYSDQSYQALLREVDILKQVVFMPMVSDMLGFGPVVIAPFESLAKWLVDTAIERRVARAEERG